MCCGRVPGHAVGLVWVRSSWRVTRMHAMDARSSGAACAGAAGPLPAHSSCSALGPRRSGLSWQAEGGCAVVVPDPVARGVARPLGCAVLPGGGAIPQRAMPRSARRRRRRLWRHPSACLTGRAAPLGGGCARRGLWARQTEHAPPAQAGTLLSTCVVVKAEERGHGGRALCDTVHARAYGAGLALPPCGSTLFLPLSATPPGRNLLCASTQALTHAANPRRVVACAGTPSPRRRASSAPTSPLPTRTEAFLRTCGWRSRRRWSTSCTCTTRSR